MCGCNGDPFQDHGSGDMHQHPMEAMFFIAAYLFADAGKTTSLAPFVHGVDDPVDAGIPADLLTVSVDHVNIKGTDYAQLCGWGPQG